MNLKIGDYIQHNYDGDIIKIIDIIDDRYYIEIIQDDSTNFWTQYAYSDEVGRYQYPSFFMNENWKTVNYLNSPLWRAINQ